LENVFAQMWARYAAGQSPAGIKSTLPNSLD